MRKEKCYYGCLYFFLFFILVLRTIVSWYNDTFGVKIQEVLFTLTSPLEGTDTEFLKGAFADCLPVIFVGTIGIIGWRILDKKMNDRVNIFLKGSIAKKNFSVDLLKVYKIGVLLLGFLLSLHTLKYVDDSLEICSYIKIRNVPTTIYEDYYVSPQETEITASGRTKNLIYIYMESMETTYASKEDGGVQEVNYIPNLTEMAQQNVSFSDSEKLGGFHSNNGSSWTIAALLSTTAGVPYALPIEGNSMDQHETFLPGVITLGDILERKGYHQEFLCGSDSSFAGRDKYFAQHGKYDIFDYYTAIQEGYIDEDYRVFWGLEDAILYEIAKDELLKISSGNQPFNFTMLTVDTHHVEGYVCNLCEDKYPVQTANVVSCADKQIYNFIEWCKQQEFYEDTVIVITGDHPRMDTFLVENVDSSDRTIYNCIINSEQEAEGSLINREFTSLDIMPTTLAAMGFEFEGDRLGLGTNLFSDRKTLAEELGIEYLNNELGKYSEYYNEKFLK